MEGNWQVIVAAGIFLITYGLIVVEKIHRTVLALMGGVAMIILGIISQEEAIHEIDFNTLGLLVGMMIIVGITRRTGVFQFLAIKAAKVAKGDPLYILAALATITAVASALLDNVTAVLLIVPVTFSITDRLNISPVPYLITEILASNIGGTATLIGDPPNIMIGSATDLGFMDFIFNLSLPAMIIFAVTLLVLMGWYRKQLQADPVLQKKIMLLDEWQEIHDWALLKKSLLVLGLTIIGFVLHQFVHLESATIALGGAVLLLILTREEPEDILLAVEWPTIFFFLGLFILVAGLQKVGIIRALAEGSLQLTGGDLLATAFLILWLSAIASAFVDNIPFVATMIPLVKTMGELSAMPLEPLWWSLALGACLGGNGTLIGASANVIVAGVAEKNGYPITFREFFKVGFPMMLLSILLSSVYIYFAYLR